MAALKIGESIGLHHCIILYFKIFFKFAAPNASKKKTPKKSNICFLQKILTKHLLKK